MIKNTIITATLLTFINGCSSFSHQASGGLVQSSCSDIEQLRSTDGRDKVSVKFSNNQQDEIQIFWLDYKGNEVHYKTLQSGQSYIQSTYVTHPWVARDTSHKCLAVYTPLRQNYEVVL